MNVVFVGRGKVARALHAKLSQTQHRSRLVASRGRVPAIDGNVDLVVLCVRDDAIEAAARRLAERPLRAAVIHVAGAQGPEALAPLAGRCAGVGRAHPLASFASNRVHPDLCGVSWRVDGERVAVSRARALVLALGGVPRRWPGVTPAAYHAAAALVANGAAALAAAGRQVLVGAGAPPRDVDPALGALLRTVAENLVRLGLPRALTGPIRRGDAATVASHLRALERQPKEIKELYRACGVAQLGLARALGEARPGALAEVARVLRAGGGVRPRRNPSKR